MSTYLNKPKEQIVVPQNPNRALRRAMQKAAKTGKEIIVVDSQGSNGMQQPNSMKQKRGLH